MPDHSPVESALDALAAYLGGVTGIDEALRGWPEDHRTLDLSGGRVVVTVIASGDPEEEPVAPFEVDSEAVNNKSQLVTYRTGWLTQGVQIDLWAAHRAVRDAGARALQDALNNDMPFRRGLFLTSTDYFERPITVLASTGVSVDDGDAHQAGEWRARWSAELTTDVVQQAVVATQTQSRLATTTTLLGVTAPAETTTID